jgi:hypothetical protein
MATTYNIQLIPLSSGQWQFRVEEEGGALNEKSSITFSSKSAAKNAAEAYVATIPQGETYVFVVP